MTSNHRLLQGMNRQQRQAITAGDGPVLVLAGPGSGKTAVLTRRIAWLIREHRVPHHRIMAVTFTNKAAGEMRSRVEALLGEHLRGLQVSTFHSACARFLRREAESAGYRPDYVIYDSDDQVALVKTVVKNLGIDPKKYNPRAILAKISSAKNEMILPAQFHSRDYFSEIVLQVYSAYQTALREANAMDFDDLLLNMVLLLRENDHLRRLYQDRYVYVLVDEFQDTNQVQYELVKLLAAPQNNVFVVGDEDQAIYAFRGADYRNVLRFQTNYSEPAVILLEQNYRSTQNILDVARALIDRNRNRTPKALHTELGRGAQVSVFEAYDERYEAESVLEQIHQLRAQHELQYKDFAVMYRTNAQSRALERAFVDATVPYILIGGVGFYKRREVKDLLAYLRLIHNPDDRVSFERVINVPARGIGRKSLDSFLNWVAREGLTVSDALNRAFYDDPTPLPAAARKKFAGFAGMLAAWQDMAKRGDLLSMFDNITAQTGYYLHLDAISKLPEEAAERADNVQELRGLLQYALEDEQPLHEFLADQSLVADVDSLSDDQDAVTLMTLHSAKGLEFPVVFITGLEAGILPHFRSLEEVGGIEEERRLFYVGVTRAKETLYLSYAFRRALYSGSGGISSPSEFLGDLPPRLLDGSPTTLASLRRAQSLEAQTAWDSPTEPLGRLRRDLQTKTVSQPNYELRKKIIPFPGLPKAPDTGAGFKVNMTVTHALFGRGKVIGVDDSGGIVSVLFDEHGLKKILADADGFRALDE
ncbi:MAG: UvrD-helicase domain-containing protein [Chloroflexota bacterium]|nr:UvrD-helicase domain-containing protein [Chloroflexota bacterium]